MSQFPVLETSRLQLIEVKPEHREQLFAIFSRAEVMRYYGMNSFTTVEQASNLIESFRQTYEDKHGIRWAMVSKETGNLVGTIGLNNLQMRSKRAEIGFESHPDLWRSGYTSEAVREVLRYSFEVLELQRVAAITFPANIASQNLLKKLGFQAEGLLRGYLYQNEQSHDAQVYSLLKTDVGNASDAIPMRSITPILRIFDVERAKEFYLEFLEFTLDWEHQYEDGFPLYLQISQGDCVIHLSEHHGDCTPGAKIQVEVQQIQKLHQKLLAKAYKYARPGLESPPWGRLEISVIDPFGNKLVFFEPVK